MSAELRQHFVTRAESLADCARLVVERVDDVMEVLRIIPHRHGAASVEMSLFEGMPLYVMISHDCVIPLEEPGRTDDLDYVIDQAVEGRVRLYIGRYRNAVIHDRTGNTYEEVGYFGPGPWFIPGLWRLVGPRWRRKAEVVTFLPYGSGKGSVPCS